VLQASLVRAVRTISVERGSDPRDFVLVPFGGAGGLHAAQLARELGVRRLLVPPSPGVLCAYGALSADVRADFSATCVADAAPSSLTSIAATFERLADRARDWLTGEGTTGAAARFAWSLDMRYAQQNSELAVPVSGRPTAQALADAVAGFHRSHQDRYGYAAPGEPVRLTTVRLTTTVPTDGLPPMAPADGARVSAAATVTREVFFEALGATVDCAVVDRASLAPGEKHEGPAIVQQTDATTVVLPGQTYFVDDVAALRIED
jgi:N-methylhydantoinase A